MTHEQINIAIAQACGVEPELVSWHAQKDGASCMTRKTRRELQDWLDKLPEGSWAKDYVPTPFYRYPNYAGSLDAMHEARKALKTDRDRNCYMTHLHVITCVPADMGWSSIDATAAQHAEAFLRTLNLWTE